MHDLFLIGFLGALLVAGFRRPFLFVLGYVYVDIVAPQHLSYYLLNSIPISLIFFVAAVGSWMMTGDKKAAAFGPRQAAMLILLLYCYVTTANADFPMEAQEKWSWVWKSLIFAVFLPLTLTTRLRIEALAVFMTLSAASIIIVGGIKTLSSGGGYGVLNLMSSSNTGLYESSTLACIAIALIPLILYLMRNGTIFPPEWRVTAFCLALSFACLLIPVGTEARTGLICIAVLGVLMLRATKRRFLYVSIVGALAIISLPFLPDSFTKRMDTLNEVQSDQSASTRLAVWKWTLDYVGDHPFGGGFDAYRGNSFRYETKPADSFDAAKGTSQSAVVVQDQARAYHSAYFEMLGEQGWLGLFIWLFIQLGGLVRMEVLRRRYRHSPAEGDQWISHLATALQHGNIIYLIGAGFVGIAFQPFIYMLVGMQIGLDSYARRRRRAKTLNPLFATAAPRA